ncbi:Uncharacterized protein CEY00_Acc10238 [Actinidia chinensis var. chinensis]|uniref:Uncharacterized protein n=1 Tax=Actinidia chinensis var. chinensis TaxID=1590841 RepID=A0A2R6R5A8_ACTCC|nr:Uncharacterized protein CEY00_Acc10238 [Actinidia chinensis var. chinensis]
MESRYHAPVHVEASRPSLGFPLGTPLLLIIIFSVSGILSCCYHWAKLRFLCRSVSADTDPEADNAEPLSKPETTHTGLKQNQSPSLPVLMPGDQTPKFIALPCPC